MATVAETIRRITREHLLERGGIVLGQCLTAVGWVGGTVPELSPEDGIVELSMADVAGGGIAVGAALAGRRPIYIVRYQGFQWYNAPIIVNYAAKSKELWGVPCPLFVRSIGMDGGIGPVASGSHHSMYTRMPGIPVCAPMTPGEYEHAWAHFMAHDDPLLVSEHRRSFPIDDAMEDVIRPQADMTIFAISSTRLNAREAIVQLQREGISCNLIHVFWLKPFAVTEDAAAALARSAYGGLVLDGDYANGVAKTIAYDLMQRARANVRVLALEERSAGFAPHLDNLPPTADRICAFVRRAVKESVAV